MSVKPKPGPCHYCGKRVSAPVPVMIYLAHSNGGAYGVDPAHAKCHKATPCPGCGDTKPERNDYGLCKECRMDHDGVRFD